MLPRGSDTVSLNFNDRPASVGNNILSSIYVALVPGNRLEASREMDDECIALAEKFIATVNELKIIQLIVCLFLRTNRSNGHV
jgi:hypothetical protein